MKAIRELASKGYTKASAVGLALFAPVLSYAQETDPFQTAMAEIIAKVGTYGAGLVGVAAAGVVFMVAMKYVKKLPRAS